MTDNFWGLFEAEVESTPPLETRYFSVHSILGIANMDRESSARLLDRVYTSIQRSLAHGLQGLRFVMRINSTLDKPFENFSELELNRSSTATGTEYFFVPVEFQVIGIDEGTAMARFGATVEWLETVHKDMDNSSAILWELTRSSASVRDSKDISLRPIIQVVNFPNAKYWELSNSDHTVAEGAIEEYVRLEQQEAYTIRTDALHEAITALETSVSLLPSVLSDSYQWKWVIQALHSTLQSFMVSALQGTNPERVLEPLVQGDTVNSSHGQGPKLKGFLDLYYDIKHKTLMLQYTNSRVFKPVGTQGSSIKELNRLRNEFIHFIPRTWIIPPEVLLGFPQLASDVIDTVEFLAIKSLRQ